jgi:ATP-dependent exoDNAse (exonuclease V), alpha subunit - helicase superfamily I member
VLPKTGRILSRELIYTALTRAKAKLILFIEDSPSWLREFTKPQYSVLGRRNTNLFEYSVREEKTKIPYVEGLIHKTLKDGLIVRSKSEVIIANMLHQRGIEFEYERTLEENGKRCIPDFTFEDASGDPIILEHLGMLNVPSYAEAWKRKLEFYKSIGYEEGENIFTTRDDDNGSIDSIAIKKVIDEIEDLI